MLEYLTFNAYIKVLELKKAHLYSVGYTPLLVSSPGTRYVPMHNVILCGNIHVRLDHVSQHFFSNMIISID